MMLVDAAERHHERTRLTDTIVTRHSTVWREANDAVKQRLVTSSARAASLRLAFREPPAAPMG
ncbi:MAG: hypothetical protein ACTHMJ_14300 [Thermomicrobiales bacterium]|jgi:hypothetical protein